MTTLITGRDAYCDGLSLQDNPHSLSTTAHKEWAREFTTAEANDPLKPEPFVDDISDDYDDDEDY